MKIQEMLSNGKPRQVDQNHGIQLLDRCGWYSDRLCESLPYLTHITTHKVISLQVSFLIMNQTTKSSL